MSNGRSYPRDWLEKVPATVFASLVRGELRLVLHAGAGLAQGGAEYDVSIDKVPAGLRMPNSKVWVKLDDQLRIVEVWHRDE